MISNIYIISYIIILVCSFFFIISNQRKITTLPIFFAYSCILIVFAGFNTLSPDYLGYKTIALNVGNYDDFYSGSSKQLHGDLTFYLISALVNSFHLDVQFVFIFIAFISVGITSYIIYKTSSVPIVSILLYSSHHYLNKDVIQIRAALSSALILLAIYFISKGRTFWGYSSYLTSFLSHSSAIVTVPPVLMSRLCPQKYVMKVFFAILIIAFTVNILGGGFFGVVPYFEFMLPVGVKNYLNWDIYNYDMGILNLSTVRAIFISLFLIYAYGKFYNTPSELILMWCYLFGTGLLIAFSDFAILSGRLSSILMSGEFIILVNAAYKMRSRFYLFFVLIYSCLLLVNNLFLSSYGLGKFNFQLF
ncbi:EpsG family protein [Shewanella mangrovisoli]|uniref:EpsG family protein n=1 Tax=Shewanella mangrovisoli TaxID=2864211 RepID=UPI00370BDEAC